MYKKVLFDGLEKEQVKHLKKPNYVNLMKTAVENSDAAIIAGDNIPEELKKFLSKLDKPVLEYKNREEFAQAYQDFYTNQVL
jgi:starch synthase